MNEGILSDHIATKVKQVLESNPYAQIFCQLKNQISFHNFQLRIAANASLDQRVYNRPSVSQVAAIWIDGNNPNISFVIPRGESGWHQGIRKQSKRLPHRRSAHSPLILNDIPTFKSADAILANEDQGKIYYIIASYSKNVVMFFTS